MAAEARKNCSGAAYAASAASVRTPMLQVLFEVKKSSAFPNIRIALRIMLTTPFTSAEAERTFSKL